MKPGKKSLKHCEDEEEEDEPPKQKDPKMKEAKRKLFLAYLNKK